VRTGSTFAPGNTATKGATTSVGIRVIGCNLLLFDLRVVRMRVYTYARYSTDRQTEASIVDQQRRCHEYATARDWPVAANFTDEGISGAALGNRPGYQRVMTKLQAGDVLLAADLTRVSRSQDLAPLLDRLRFRGVRIIGVLDGFDSESPQARMQAGLSGLMSDELRAGIRARTHSALQMRAMAGRATGGKVYGYDSRGQVIETEAMIVREIFERFARGESMKSIVRDLNVRKVPSRGSAWKRSLRRKDGCWLISSLNPLLQNERYAGRVVWNRSTWVKDPDSGQRTRRERPESEWIVTSCPALIEASVWSKVQQRCEERATGQRAGRPRRYLLSGLLVCEQCGARLVVTSKPARYGCGTYLYGGRAACRMDASAKLEDVEAAVLGPVRAALLTDEAIERFCLLIREWYRREHEQASQGLSPAAAAIGSEIADLESLIAERPARAETLHATIQDLRQKQANLQRAAWRRKPFQDVVLPAEEAYRAAVADMNGALKGSNIERPRVVLCAVCWEKYPCFRRDGSWLLVLPSTQLRCCVTQTPSY
jgi:site-specific DNA recombinase